MKISSIAKELNIPSKVLEEKSLRAFLERELHLVESELFSLAKKYGVKSIRQFEQKVKKGKIPEAEDSLEDFFRFDHLEAKRDRIRKVLKTL